ncbi:MAG: glycosyltransferase [Oscillospiraceae bacterium]|nr:glycosyltransferase [Oscillospiraceae bacterium]
MIKYKISFLKTQHFLKKIKSFYPALLLLIALCFNSIFVNLQKLHTQDNTKIAVIVPVYNTEKYLTSCVNSIINQTLRKISIILVDDCSTDNSLQILKKYEKNNRVKILQHDHNKGGSAARNTGIKYAISMFKNLKYITFVDSDDIIESDTYEKAFEEALMDDADILAFAADTKHPSFENNNGLDNKKGGHKPEDKVLRNYNLHDRVKAFEENEIQTGFPMVWNKLYSTKIFREILFMEDLQPHEDLCFNAMAYIRAKTIKFIPNVFYHWRIYGNSTGDTTSQEKSLKLLELSRSHIIEDWKKCKVPEEDIEKI